MESASVYRSKYMVVFIKARISSRPSQHSEGNNWTVFWSYSKYINEANTCEAFHNEVRCDRGYDICFVRIQAFCIERLGILAGS